IVAPVGRIFDHETEIRQQHETAVDRTPGDRLLVLCIPLLDDQREEAARRRAIRKRGREVELRVVVPPGIWRKGSHFREYFGEIIEPELRHRLMTVAITSPTRPELRILEGTARLRHEVTQASRE